MNWLKLDEAAAITGRPEPTLRRWLNAGTIPGRKVPWGKRETWEISQETIDQILSQGNKADDYATLYKEWTAALRSGAICTKPMKQNSIDTLEDGLNNYWHYLKIKPSVAAINAIQLKEALCKVPIDYETKNCHYGIRYNMCMGVRSFIRLLVAKGYRTQADLNALTGLLPKRVFPPRKTILEEDAYKKLLAVNDAWRERRSEYDILLTRTIIILSSMTGLRNAEMRNLMLTNVDMFNRIIYVVLGKGNKNRAVGITTELHNHLKLYLSKRPNSKHPHFLLTRSGTPLSGSGLNHRITTVAEKAKIDITPHGLRRTFATMNIKKGMPLPVAQKLLGHSNIKTTMEYVLIDEMQAVDFLREQ